MVDQVFSDRYELVRLIARGGMAEVYLARDQRLDRQVAVKVLSAEFAKDPSFVARFRHEAQAAANLNHPNLVSIFDWGQEGGTYFIVMEYVEGQSLKDLLRDESTLPADEAARIGADIAAALAYAHKNGVVHRDVKPANVLLTRDRQVKVADLGIALVDTTSEGLTQTGSVMGTATYFSPEQAQGKTVDGRSDVYSLGVVLYEMVTGTPPFVGANPVTVAYQHVQEKPDSLTQKLPAVPAAYDQIVMTALAKDPGQRYPTADDLRADLLRFRAGQNPQGAAVTAMAPAVAADQTMLAEAVPEDDESNKRWGWKIAAIVAAVVLLGVVAVILFTGGGGNAAKVSVPNVVGTQVAEAELLLEAEGLEMNEIPQESEEPEGTVVRQDPGANSEVDEGSTVDVYVSEGAAEVEVPDVVGMTYTEADNTLRQEGFVADRQEEESEDVPAGQVIRTDPEAGEMHERNGTVVVYVSMGQGDVEVPQLAGLTAASAANQLGQLGFQIGDQIDEESEDVPAGQVIRTDPAAGTLQPFGTTVTLVVSSGPGTAEVPDVIGMTTSQAVAALRAAGFIPNIVDVPSTPANQGLVVAVTPGEGSTQPRGTTITISVGDGSV